MSASLQFDPALKQLLLQKTGNPLGEGVSEDVGGQEVSVLVRLNDPSLAVPSLRLVSLAGNIATGRVALADIVRVRQDSNVLSFKLSQVYAPTLATSVPEIRADPASLREEVPAGVTGRGIVIGILDWGLDFAHANFRQRDGSTRLIALWDQRGGEHPLSPAPYGYGREFTQERINDALCAPDPYIELGYDPATSDPSGKGTHGTHTTDIAAGNGLAAGSSPGVAPEASIIFVNLKSSDTAPEDTLGDSVRILEAVHYIIDRAGAMPVVINMSIGRTGGPHDESPLIVQGLDHFSRTHPNVAFTFSAGNYWGARLHSMGNLSEGDQVELRLKLPQKRRQPSEIEIWYSGSDIFTVELIDPDGIAAIRVELAEDEVVKDGATIILSAFHRRQDPNNGDNQADVFIWPAARGGIWTLRLTGMRILDGKFHAWIERERADEQARFVPTSADPTHTTGTICNGVESIAVGAYDASSQDKLLAPFSSGGPTRNGRPVPWITAPGMRIMAARSAPLIDGVRLRDGLTVMSGTSMAAPHVAGVVALMFEAAGEQSLSSRTIKKILAKTARADPLHTADDNQRSGAGRVDAAAAVHAVTEMRRTALMTMRSDEVSEIDIPKGANCKETSSNSPSPASAISALAKAPSQASDDRTSFNPNIQWLGSNPSASAAADCNLLKRDYTEVAEEEYVRRITIMQMLTDLAPSTPITSRLAAVLRDALPSFGEAALSIIGPNGLPLYDKLQFLWFAPTDRSYTNTAGRYNYHGGNFVWNTLYEAGFDVPTFPLGSVARKNGQAYLNLAQTFDGLLGHLGVQVESYLSQFLEIVLRPGEYPAQALFRGDMVLGRPDEPDGLGVISIIVDPVLRPLSGGWFLSGDRESGFAVHCIDACGSVRRNGNRFGRVLADPFGAGLDNRMVVRLRDRALEPDRLASRMSRDLAFREVVDRGSWLAEIYEGIDEAEPGADSAPLPKSGPASVSTSCPPFLPANLSTDYTRYVQPQTLGLVHPLINGRSSGGAGPDVNVTEPFFAMEAAVKALGQSDFVYLSAWFFEPATLLTGGAYHNADSWGALFAEKAIQGVKVRIIINDFDTISGMDQWLQTSCLDPLNTIIKAMPATKQENFKYIVSMHPAHIGFFKSLFSGQSGRNIYIASHHQKFMITRRRDELTAFCGGLDIESRKTPARWDYKGLIGWHDVHLKLEGPITRDLEKEFVMRWNREKGSSTRPPLPNWAPFETLTATSLTPADNVPAKKLHRVQMIRTASTDSFWQPYSTERNDISDVYRRGITCAGQYIYLENQYYRSTDLADWIARRGQAVPNLIVIMVVVASAAADDGTNPITEHGNYLQHETFRRIFASLGQRARLYTMTKRAVHSKLMMVDDGFMLIGSANANTRSFELDSELNVTIGEPSVVIDFRRRLWAHNLGVSASTVAGWRVQDFIARWDAVAKANNGLAPPNMAGEGIVPLDYTAMRGTRHGSIPDALTGLDLAPESRIFAGQIPPDQQTIRLA